MVTDEPDLSRAASDYVFENGVWLYHENVTPTEHGYWVEAKDLRVGDVFLGANGELSTLINIVRVEQGGGIGVFNIRVEGNHNYYILAKEEEYGQTCILVHNSEECFGFRVMAEDEYTKAARGVFEDGSLVSGDIDEMGSKWMWDNLESAESWKDFCDANGDIGQIITKVDTLNPMDTYPHFPHDPQGTAYHVPIPELIKATIIGQ